MCRSNDNKNESENQEPNLKIQKIDDDSEDTEVDTTLYYRIAEIFPDACPKYIKKLCAGHSYTPHVLDDIISSILSSKFCKLQ